VTSLTVGGHVLWFPYAIVLVPNSVFLVSIKAISSETASIEVSRNGLAREVLGVSLA